MTSDEMMNKASELKQQAKIQRDKGNDDLADNLEFEADYWIAMAKI